MPQRAISLSSAYLLTAAVGGLLIGLAPLMAPAGALKGLPGVFAFTASSAAAVAWGLFFAIKGHRALDEYQRERARRAFYWGTTGGIVASAPIYTFIAIGGLHRIDAAIPVGRPLAIAFAGGYGLALVSVMLGTTIAAMVLRRAKLSIAA